MVALYWVRAVLALALASTSYSFAITGLRGGVDTATGERPVRKEISTFEHDGPAFDLYILALQHFMRQNQSDPLSYFQISGGPCNFLDDHTALIEVSVGIHGYPQIAWDGANGQHRAGYCPHGSVLFPTWHRIYLALFEQILSGHAQTIASTYPDALRAKYQSAATTLRMPYWDWALNATMPDVVNQPSIIVNTPNGSQSIENPLYTYRFHPLPSQPEFPGVSTISKAAQWPNTVRYPDAEGRSQPDLANEQLQIYAAPARSAVYLSITMNTEYAPFSNTAYQDGHNGAYNNIENIHNGIHVWAGGRDGHLQFVPLSAFEPVFWLHHTNVDRQFALWQASNPGSYDITAQADAVGTYTNAPGSTEDANTALTPFHDDNTDDFYNSTGVRSTRDFGYTYPELLDWKVSTSQLTSDVKATINSLYGPASQISSRKLKSRVEDETASVDDTIGYHYGINVAVNGSDVLTGMYIRFFLGAIPLSESAWSTAPTLIGSHIITAHSRGIVFGQVPFDFNSLPLEPSLPSLEAKNVIPLIQEKLNYRFQCLDGRAMDPNILPSLKFAVVGRSMTDRGPSEFPLYGPTETYTEATRHLGPYGLQAGERMPG